MRQQRLHGLFLLSNPSASLRLCSKAIEGGNGDSQLGGALTRVVAVMVTCRWPGQSEDNLAMLAML
jgi:hypothetical protein